MRPDIAAKVIVRMPEVVGGLGSRGRAGGGVRSGLGWFECDLCIGPHRSREAQPGVE